MANSRNSTQKLLGPLPKTLPVGREGRGGSRRGVQEGPHVGGALCGSGSSPARTDTCATPCSLLSGWLIGLLDPKRELIRDTGRAIVSEDSGRFSLKSYPLGASSRDCWI